MVVVGCCESLGGFLGGRELLLVAGSCRLF